LASAAAYPNPIAQKSAADVLFHALRNDLAQMGVAERDHFARAPPPERTKRFRFYAVMHRDSGYAPVELWQVSP
jgi:hypothetical protein